MNSVYNVLVTGGAGMIGSNLVRSLVSVGHNVIVVDNLWRGKKEYLQDANGSYYIDMKNNFHNIDLSVSGSIDHLVDNIDYIYHLADVVAGVDYVFNNQLNVFRQNILINSNTIESVGKTRNLKGFIYVGTACSFPAHLQIGVEAPPLVEEDQYPAHPESAYGWSKLMGEYEASLLQEERGIPVSILSFHNVYGSPCDFTPEKSQVIPSLVRKAIRYPDEAFSVWGSGEQGRAFVHVNDVVEALLSAMENGLGEGIIQIGPSVCTSIRAIAEAVVEVSGKQINIQYDLEKPVGDMGRCADYSKALRILGWQPKTSLKSGITELYSYIQNRISNQADR